MKKWLKYLLILIVIFLVSITLSTKTMELTTQLKVVSIFTIILWIMIVVFSEIIDIIEKKTPRKYYLYFIISLILALVSIRMFDESEGWIIISPLIVPAILFIVFFITILFRKFTFILIKNFFKFLYDKYIDLSYWLRGGIIGFIVWIIFKQILPRIFLPEWLRMSMIYFEYPAVMVSTLGLWGFSQILVFIYYVGLGALIGWIIWKIKRKNLKINNT